MPVLKLMSMPPKPLILQIASDANLGLQGMRSIHALVVDAEQLWVNESSIAYNTALLK